MNSNLNSIASRIRITYKDHWKHDLLCIKNGNHDHCINGEMSMQALRQFQSSQRSPAKDFKLVPEGFIKDMAYMRKILPKGDQV